MSRTSLPLRLLARRLPGRLGAEVVDELEEAYRERSRASGPVSAHIWLWRQVLHPDTARLVRALGDADRRHDERGRPTTTARRTPRARRRPLSELAWHLRFGVRGLARRPGLTLSIVSTLALGIGANTAVFSVIDGVLLEPLPFPDGDRLVYVWGATSDDATELLSGPQAAEVLQVDAFEDAALVFGFGRTSMVREVLPEPVRTLTVGHGFFHLHAVEPLLGRGFVASDEFKLSNEQIRDPDFVRPVGAVVLRFEFWRDRFGADPGVLGDLMDISGHRHRIVGVMPPGFRAHLPSELEETVPEDVWIMSPYDQPSFPRDTRFVRAIARVPDGTGLDRVQDELDQLASWQRANFPEDARDDFRLRASWLQDEAGATARQPLATLLAAVAFVLLIACANVATLLLVRAFERDEELRLRRALGASRGHLASLALSESLVVAVCGGGIGVALAQPFTSLLVELAPPEIPRLDSVHVDGSVLAFTAALTIGVAILAGLLPAIRSARTASPGAGLRAVGSRRERATGSVLVTLEVALAVVLVTGSGLLLRSLGNTFAVDPGYATDGVYTWEANLTTPTHPSWASRVTYFRDVQESLLAEPGVRAVGVMTPVPLDGVDRAEVRLGMDESARALLADYRRTAPGALEALEIEVVQGRSFEWRDMEDFDRLFAVVDERFARAAWPSLPAVGQVISMQRREYGDGSRVWDDWKRIEVIGVVESVRGRDVRTDDLPTVYVTYSQNMWGRPVFVAASNTPLPSQVVRERSALTDPRPLLTDVVSLDEIGAERLSALHFALTLIGLFALLGLTLAATGVYGLLSYSVGRRARELNIRAALGADGPRLSTEVVRSGLRMTGVGVVAGWAAAWWLTRFIESLLFDVTPLDPLTYVTVGGMLLAVAGVASWVPARTAWRRDPVELLR